MRVAALEIHNFRGIKQAKLVFSQHTVFIGPNNTGKTTIIEALALLLGRDRMVRSLTEHDFYQSCPGPTDRIKIIAAIGGFSGDDPDVHPDWISARRGVAKWINPQTGEVQAIKDADHSELVCEIALVARFDADSLEVEHVRYFQDDVAQDPFDEDSVTFVSQSLLQDLGFFLISARRSWDRMFSFGSELFRRVIAATEGLPASTIIKERDLLRTPATPLEADPKLKPVIEEVEREMESLFATKGHVRLRITSTDSEGVMDAIVPHYTADGSTTVPANRQGSGTISLQSLFLLLHFGKQRVADGKGFIIALEEPELHLPPAIQRRVLHRLQALSSQTIITTHSPLVAAFAQPTELRVVRNTGGSLTAKPMLRAPLEHSAPNALRRLFQIRRVEVAGALMNEVVLVPEGPFDLAWFQLLQRVTELEQSGSGSEFGVRVGMLEGGTDTLPMLVKTLADAHPCISVIVDGDGAGKGYAKQLDTAGSGARFILRWPDDWAIEDVIGWVMRADENALMTALANELPHKPSSIDELIAWLKSDDRKDPKHLKGDRVSYEIIASTIAENKPSIVRVRELLDSVAAAARGVATPRFVVTPPSRIAVFQP